MFHLNFNPIIVLFLTVVSYSSKAVPTRFQSYYSLIFNLKEQDYIKSVYMIFQSYYSLIFNTILREKDDVVPTISILL